MEKIKSSLGMGKAIGKKKTFWLFTTTLAFKLNNTKISKTREKERERERIIKS